MKLGLKLGLAFISLLGNHCINSLDASSNFSITFSAFLPIKYGVLKSYKSLPFVHFSIIKIRQYWDPKSCPVFLWADIKSDKNLSTNEVNELWMYLSQILSKAFKLVQNPSFQISFFFNFDNWMTRNMSRYVIVKS